MYYPRMQIIIVSANSEMVNNISYVQSTVTTDLNIHISPTFYFNTVHIYYDIRKGEYHLMLTEWWKCDFSALPFRVDLASEVDLTKLYKSNQ